ncbi:MAG: family 10 glycosylhydrolase [Clostridia bacterium]|nr:family 10 glycosylhydrolase [Clostridia bacterium]
MKRLWILVAVLLFCTMLGGCFEVDDSWKPVYSGKSTTTDWFNGADMTTSISSATSTAGGTAASSSSTTTDMSTQTETMTETTPHSTTKTTVTTTTTTTTTRKSSTTKTSTTTKPATTTTKPQGGTTEKTEIRAAWVSYIELNTLFSQNPTPQTAKAAIRNLLGGLKSKNINTVYWIMRANSDAYYKSAYYPANQYAKPLIDAGFDPLTYIVETAHSYGLELHAWVNPYRIGRVESNARNDEYFYYDSKYFYIPTSSTVQTLILNGVRELVQNYDIDGIHFDDYFYPADCAAENKKADFETGSPAAGQSWGDWRRAAVSSLVRAVYAVCHGREGCAFGISPSHSIEKNRDRYFADVETWLSTAGYLDYMCPQVYFGLEHSSAAFDKTVDIWRNLDRHKSVKLLFGLGVYKAGLKVDTYAGNAKDEWIKSGNVLKREVEYLRRCADVDGLALYSFSYLTPTVAVANNADYNLDKAKEEINNLLSIL